MQVGASHSTERQGNYAFAVAWLACVSMIFVEWRGVFVKVPPEEIGIYDWLLPGPYVYLTFPVFLAWAYRTRQRPEWHKRLITFALFLSLQAAIQRFLWLPTRYGYWPFAGFLDICLLAPLVSYDLTKLKGRLHPATLRGALVCSSPPKRFFFYYGAQPPGGTLHMQSHTLCGVIR